MPELTAVETAQQAIDAIAYPPTHAYNVATLQPRGVLAERLQRILAICPAFFSADAFLDVGASKGFFSLRAARESASVLAIDPDAAALAAWAPVKPDNVDQLVGSFASIDPREQFDMVWIGNGHHYLQRENPRWVELLDAVATDRVVIEGPTGRLCRDVADGNAWPDVLEEEALLDVMRGAGFWLLGSSPSPKYTPHRATWSFRRRAPRG